MCNITVNIFQEKERQRLADLEEEQHRQEEWEEEERRRQEQLAREVEEELRVGRNSYTVISLHE